MAASADNLQGAAAIWDRLTPDDVKRIKRELAVRRSEMLAQHAAELKAVHAERDESDPIEQAVIAVTQRFKIAEGGDSNASSEPRHPHKVGAPLTR
jgi:hypothetical protein